MMSAVTYYFNNSREKAARGEEEEGADVMYGFKAAYLHHIGSIAFGAFIITLVKVVKVIFYYLAKMAEKSAGENSALKCMVGCITCILNCVEEIVDYLNESAFAYMAVTGDKFLTSAWNGFLINLKHGLKFAFAQMIASVFVWMGKIGIVIGNCFTCFIIMKYITHDVKEVKSVWPPLIMTGTITFLIASLFLSIFEETVTAIMMSLSIDIDANQGEPQFGPATFHDGYFDKFEERKRKANEVE